MQIHFSTISSLPATGGGKKEKKLHGEFLSLFRHPQYTNRELEV